MFLKIKIERIKKRHALDALVLSILLETRLNLKKKKIKCLV
jgi:hypothetical protein